MLRSLGAKRLTLLDVAQALGVSLLRGLSAELDRRHLSLQLIPKMGRRLDLGAAFQTSADAMIVHAGVDPEPADTVRAMHKPLVLSFPLDATTRAGVLTQSWPAPSGTISGERIAGDVAAVHEAGCSPERLRRRPAPASPPSARTTRSRGSAPCRRCWTASSRAPCPSN